MSQIGTLVTGAGVQTTIPGQAQCEAVLLIGGVGTANPLQGLSIDVDGQTFFNVSNNANLLTAYAKWLSQWVSTALGVVFKIATGRIPKVTTYRLTNSGATTPAIYAFSDSDMGVPFQVATTTINATSSQDFINFSALIIDSPTTTIDNVDIVFNNGFKATLTYQELNALQNLKFPSEANGFTGVELIIDNTDQSIQSVRINTLAACTLIVAKIPDAAWKAWKAGR